MESVIKAFYYHVAHRVYILEDKDVLKKRVLMQSEKEKRKLNKIV